MPSEPDLEKSILNRLLERYEKSASFRGGQGHVYLSYNRDSDFLEKDNYEEHVAFHTAVKNLEKDNLITYSWQKGEKDNLFDKITLKLDEASISKAYARTKRPVLNIIIESLSNDLDTTLSCIENPAIRHFLEIEKTYIDSKRKISRYFFEDCEKNSKLLLALAFLADNKEEILERVFSTRRFGDSKYFERTLKSKLLSILRKACKESGVERDDELLALFSLRPYPEIISFNGRLIVHFKDGRKTDFSPFTTGCHIDTASLKLVEKIEIKNAAVLFIENKANYNDIHECDVCTIFHGGFHGQAKADFFRLVGENNCRFYHFGDIDFGGFNIFIQLKELIPALKPFSMDRATLEANLDKAVLIKDSAYLDKLSSLLSDIRYSEFHEVIRFMLNKKVRLEQENLEKISLNAL